MPGASAAQQGWLVSLGTCFYPPGGYLGLVYMVDSGSQQQERRQAPVCKCLWNLCVHQICKCPLAKQVMWPSPDSKDQGWKSNKDILQRESILAWGNYGFLQNTTFSKVFCGGKHLSYFPGTCFPLILVISPFFLWKNYSLFTSIKIPPPSHRSE